VASPSPRDLAEYLESRKFTVLFSGGKDSLAALLWVLNNVKSEKWNILYVEVTGNTSPLCTGYVRGIAKELGIDNKLIIAKREDLDFFNGLKRWGIPLIGEYRWCLYQFKIKVFQKYAYPVHVTGIRHADSWRRRRVKTIEYRSLSDAVIVNPLLEWSKNQVLKYIKQHRVPLNPCYDIYGHSGNCMFCPYHNELAVIKTLLDPYWRQKITDALQHMKAPYSKRVAEKWLKYAKRIENGLHKYIESQTP